jgi:hypothetical protein
MRAKSRGSWLSSSVDIGATVPRFTIRYATRRQSGGRTYAVLSGIISR